MQRFTEHQNSYLTNTPIISVYHVSSRAVSPIVSIPEAQNVSNLQRYTKHLSYNVLDTLIQAEFRSHLLIVISSL